VPHQNNGILFFRRLWNMFDCHCSITFFPQKKNPRTIQGPGIPYLILGCYFTLYISKVETADLPGRSSGFRIILLTSLPIRPDSGIPGFHPRLQRRVRDGFSPSSLFPKNNNRLNWHLCQAKSPTVSSTEQAGSPSSGKSDRRCSQGFRRLENWFIAID
jgi:hypothetical protein